ncbi:MAG: hypothetical protein AAF065_15340 [Verrucomicrobiota bacterium]
MFKDERPRVVVGIKNTSKNDLTLFKSVDWFEEVEFRNAQLWFEYDTGNEHIVATSSTHGRDWQKMISSEVSGKERLLAGEQMAAETRDIRVFGDWRDVNTQSVRALLLVGENQYLASDWKTVSFADQSFQKGGESFTIEYNQDSEFLRDRIPHYDGISRTPAFINEIGGEQWLFLRNMRLCKVPKGSELRFEINEETEVLTIHFDGTDYEPVVHNIRMIRTLSGPRELIPHFYAVEDMEVELAAIDSPTSPALETVKTVKEATALEPVTEEPAKVLVAEPVEEEVEQSSNWWLWLIGAVVVVGGVFVLRSRK